MILDILIIEYLRNKKKELPKTIPLQIELPKEDEIKKQEKEPESYNYDNIINYIEP